MKKEVLKFNNEKWTLCEKKNSMKKLFPKHGFQPPKKKTFLKMFLTIFFPRITIDVFSKIYFQKYGSQEKPFFRKSPF